jgi:hypothetical protein
MKNNLAEDVVFTINKNIKDENLQKEDSSAKIEQKFKEKEAECKNHVNAFAIIKRENDEYQKRTGNDLIKNILFIEF